LILQEDLITDFLNKSKRICSASDAKFRAKLRGFNLSIDEVIRVDIIQSMALLGLSQGFIISELVVEIFNVVRSWQLADIK